eukprot:scaffold955_cov79-Skeletonema_dohrnii-CCMP3373.AAC.11
MNAQHQQPKGQQRQHHGSIKTFLANMHMANNARANKMNDMFAALTEGVQGLQQHMQQMMMMTVQLQPQIQGYSQGPPQAWSYQQHPQVPQHQQSPQNHYQYQQTTGNIPPNPQGIGEQYQHCGVQGNPRKYFNNWNMCCTCGFDVPSWHNSATCPQKHTNLHHYDDITRDNYTAYESAGWRVSKKGRHKYLLPMNPAEVPNATATNHIDEEHILTDTVYPPMPTPHYEHQANNYYSALQVQNEEDVDMADGETIIIEHQANNYYNILEIDDEEADDISDDETVITSNVHDNSVDVMPSNIVLPIKNVIDIMPSNIVLPTRNVAWQNFVQANNIQQTSDNANITRVLKEQYAIGDSGATDHFLIEGAPVTNKREAVNPITITQPDGTTIKSTHTCNLDIPWLPAEMTAGHIVPGLSHSSLISIRRFCDAGCKVVFDIDECRVYYQGRLVLSGGREPRTGLWRLPINPVSPHRQETVQGLDLHIPMNHPMNDAAMNVYTIPYRQNQVKYMHQTFFSLPKHTLIKAINNDQLEGIPFMKADMLRKHLADSPATSKGRMKKPKAGIRSTTPKEAKDKKKERKKTEPVRIQQIHPNAIRTNANIIPNDDEATAETNVFCYAALADKKKGTLYTDATGKLPERSLDGMVAYLIAYAYDLNYIFAIPVKDLTNESMIAAFEDVFTQLKEKGYKPALNVTDNQAATAIKEYLKKEDCEWQFVEPHNHRVNAAERAIQTFKNHFISGLCSTDKDWPLQLWDQLTEQAIITINLVRTSRIDPTKSAYHQFHGHKYDWNRFPMAPPGTKAVVYESPDQRTSWGTRGVDAWYCGPALDHYRNCRFYVPATRSYRTSGSFDLFPQHCLLPTLNNEQHAEEVYDEFIESVPRMKKPAKKRLLQKMQKALRQLSNTVKVNPIERVETPIERVDAPIERVDEVRDIPMVEVTTSTNPTDQRTLRTKPRTHLRQTRANTPGQLPHIINEANPIIDEEEHVRIQPITPNSTRLPIATSHIITQEALNAVTDQVYYQDSMAWTPRDFLTAATNEIRQNYDVDIEHFCAGVVHPVTGETINNYRKLASDPVMKPDWTKEFGREFGNIAQGDKLTGEKGTNCVFVMTPDEIMNIPSDRVVTYARIVVDYRPQKKNPNRVRITAGGNLLEYPGELTTRTADLTTSKVLWNSVISTEGAKFMGMDVKSFYLCTPMDRYEYMKMPLSIFPEHVKEQYNLEANAKNGFVYLEIRKAIYGLPQGGILANQLLRKRLAPEGYYEVAHTPGLWRHVTRPLQFTLVVDDFGVKYERRKDVDHLLKVLEKHYTVEVDWTGSIYCGIELDWHYESENRYVELSMQKYVPKVLQRFDHKTPSKPQHSPFQAAPKKYGAAAQDPFEVDETDLLDEKGKKRVQQVVGAVLYYARAVDNTLLAGLSSIASEQANATENTEKRIQQLLDYLATHPDARIRFYPSNMILNIHSDASYLSESRARSRMAGYFFLGTKPVPGEPIQLNGAIFVYTGIIKFTVASAAEAELGALFLNCREGKVIRLMLEELGHKQPPTQVHCDNQTATGIANNTVKKQRSRAMDMRFFWITDQVAMGFFDVQWHPGQENLADYFTKHFDSKHHQAVRPWYLHMSNSPRVLPRAVKPSTLRGCVGTLPNGYTKSGPLPKLVPIRPLDTGRDRALFCTDVAIEPIYPLLVTYHHGLQ